MADFRANYKSHEDVKLCRMFSVRSVPFAFGRIEGMVFWFIGLFDKNIQSSNQQADFQN
jgi:hypothetical protein